MTTTTQPPGQLHLYPPAPAASSTSYRVITPPPSAWDTPRCSDAIRDLTIAATRAAVAAERHGTAWLLAADDSGIAITADGQVHDLRGEPLSGWAVSAARIITNRKGPLAP